MLGSLRSQGRQGGNEKVEGGQQLGEAGLSSRWGVWGRPPWRAVRRQHGVSRETPGKGLFWEREKQARRPSTEPPWGVCVNAGDSTAVLPRVWTAAPQWQQGYGGPSRTGFGPSGRAPFQGCENRSEAPGCRFNKVPRLLCRCCPRATTPVEVDKVEKWLINRESKITSVYGSCFKNSCVKIKAKYKH